MHDTKVPVNLELEKTNSVMKSMRKRNTPVNLVIQTEKPSNMRHIMTVIVVVLILMTLMLVGDHVFRIYY